MKVRKISKKEVNLILSKTEGHFCDVKSKRIAPAKLSKSLSAFGNADGGELFIGIEDHSVPSERWIGFANPEEANEFIAVFDKHFPKEQSFHINF